MVKGIQTTNFDFGNELEKYTQKYSQDYFKETVNGVESMDCDVIDIDLEAMSLNEYVNNLDKLIGNYQNELNNINKLIAVLEYKSGMDYKEWVLKYKGTYDIDELRKMSGEMTEEDLSNVKDILNQLKQDKAIFESAVYKIEQLKKTAEYDYLNQVNDYKNYTGPTRYSEEELNKINYEELFTKVYEGNLESYCITKGIDINKIDLKAFYEKAKNEYSGGYEAYCKDSELANLYELGNEDYIRKYNYYYDKYGKEKTSKYLTDMKDTINEGIGAKRAEEYLSTLKMDENGNYDLSKISNYLSTILKGGGEGFNSFFEGLTAWLQKDHVYSTSEYEVMYIIQALKENENLFNILDNVFELSQSAGNMLPGMIIGMMTTPLVGTISMGTSAGGSSYHTAMANGSARVDALIYGILSGTSEATLQHFLGAIPGLNDVSVTSFKTWIQSIGKEGLEEFVQEYMDGSFREGVLGEDINQLQLFLDALKSFGYGAIMGGTSNGVNFASNTVIDKINNSKVDEVIYKPSSSKVVNDSNLNTNRTKKIADIEDQITLANDRIRKDSSFFATIDIKDVNSISYDDLNKLNNPKMVQFRLEDGKIITYDDLVIEKVRNDGNLSNGKLANSDKEVNDLNLNTNITNQITNFKNEVGNIYKNGELTIENILSIANKCNINIKDYAALNLLNYIKANNGDISNFMTVELFKQLNSEEQLNLLQDCNEKFNLEQFMLNKTDCDGGILYISDTTKIMTDNFTTKYIKDGGEHGFTVEAIYSALNGKNFEFSGGIWQYQVVEDGKICAQLCSGCSSPLWIPSEITKNQYDQLVSFNEQIKEIYLKNKEYFDKNPMEFEVSIGLDFENGFSTENNIDDVLLELQKINNFEVNDNITSEITAEITPLLDATANLSDKLYHVIDDVENAIQIMINTKNLTREQALDQIKAVIDNQNYKYITREGNARENFKKYSFEDIEKAYNQIMANENPLNAWILSDNVNKFDRTQIEKIINEYTISDYMEMSDKELKRFLNNITIDDFSKIIDGAGSWSIDQLTKIFSVTNNQQTEKLTHKIMYKKYYSKLLMNLIDNNIDISKCLESTSDRFYPDFFGHERIKIIDNINDSNQIKRLLLNDKMQYNDMFIYVDLFADFRDSYMIDSDPDFVKKVVNNMPSDKLVEYLEKEHSDRNKNVKLLRLLDDVDQINYLKNNLELSLKNELYTKYGISFLFDEKSNSLVNFAENDMLNIMYDKLKLYVPMERIQQLKGSYKFYNSERFKKMSSCENAMAYNDGKISVMDTAYEFDIIKNNIVHESVHGLSANDNEFTYKRGFMIGERYVGLNECATEYINEIIMGDDYYTKKTGKIYSGYQSGVEKLKQIINTGVINKEKFMEAYFNNNIDYFYNQISKLCGPEFCEELLNSFDNAIDSNHDIRNKALDDLDSKIVTLRLKAKKGWWQIWKK